MTNTINLLQTKTGANAQILAWETKLRSIALVCVAALVVSGAVIATSWTALTWERRTLTETKERLRQAIGGQRTKEGLLVWVKQRTQTVAKILATQRPVASILDTVTTVTPPPSVETISYDEKGQVRFTVKTASLEAAAAVVTAIVTQVQEKRIVNPQLVGLSLGRDRSVQMTIAFVQGK